MSFLRWLASLLSPSSPPPTPPPTPTPTPAPDPAPTPAPLPEPAPASVGVVAALTVERAAHQLKPLVEDAKLANLAGAWAVEMAGRNRLAHGDFSGRISAAYPNTAAAENIAEGVSSVAAVVAMWMNSPPHRANILGPFTIAGAGRAAADDGTVYWCVDFDAP